MYLPAQGAAYNYEPIDQISIAPPSIALQPQLDEHQVEHHVS